MIALRLTPGAEISPAWPRRLESWPPKLNAS